jgi:hypothetical protein
MVLPSASLVVPFRFDDPVRERTWAWTRAWYQDHHPGYDITVGLLPHGVPWSKGRAVRDALPRARRRVWVIADADVYVAPDVLDACVLAVAAEEVPWAMPHGVVYRLSIQTTNMIITGAMDPVPRQLPRRYLERGESEGPWGGGIVVLSDKAWEVSGGIDPRFEGWGGEDEAWARALNVLVGQGERAGYPMFHLFHERQERRPGNRGSEETERLAARYLDAVEDPEEMRRLVQEHAG